MKRIFPETFIERVHDVHDAFVPRVGLGENVGLNTVAGGEVEKRYACFFVALPFLSNLVHKHRSGVHKVNRGIGRERQ